MANHPASIPANSNGAYPDETPSGNLNPHDINHEGPSEGYTGTGAPNPSEADNITATGPDADAINRGGSVGSDAKDGMTGTRGNANTSN